MSEKVHSTAVEFGRSLTRGALIEVANWLSLGFAAVFSIALIAQAAGFGWDSTDDRARGLHSNLRLRTDHGTGCQYLESSDGALTPRLDAAGRQVCR